MPSGQHSVRCIECHHYFICGDAIALKCPKCECKAYGHVPVGNMCGHCGCTLKASPRKPEEKCTHEIFDASVDVNRLTNGIEGRDDDRIRFQADVRIVCRECGQPFRFIGLPTGLDLNGAAVSADATEGRFAIAPRDEVLSFVDSGCTGFSVRVEK